MNRNHPLCLLVCIAALASRAAAQSPRATNALTFHAGFDGGADADFGAGDRRIYTAPNYKAQSEAVPGLANPDVEIAKGAGRKGDALRFKKKNVHAIFFKAGKNVAFDERNWTGTISFWLRLDPDKELEPGFCDPIQVTDKAYNDSAIWVDFTKDEKPRHFRLGVFGALASWNPENTPSDKTPKFSSRLVVVQKPPFTAGRWVNVAITYSGLGSGKGQAQLYLNGESMGRTPPIEEKLQWDLSKAAIRLGVNYVGLFDELAIYNRELTAAEIGELQR
jgi:Concanavalin A-like lectin/glucanases superfamily